MAPIPKGITNLKQKRNSAPSNPRTLQHDNLHVKSAHVPDSPLKAKTIKASQDHPKPSKNYLKPTINSCHDGNCHKAPTQPELEPIINASKCTPSYCKKSIDSANSTSCQHVGNYLRHTINSCHDTTCHYPKQQNPQEFAVQPMTLVRNPSNSRRSNNNAHSTSSWPISPHKVAPKETTNNASKPVSRASPKPSNVEKATKHSAASKPLPLRKANSLPKTTSTSRTKDSPSNVANYEDEDITARVNVVSIKSPSSKHSSKKSSPQRSSDGNRRHKVGSSPVQQKKEAEARKLKFKPATRVMETLDDENGLKESAKSVVLKRQEVNKWKEAATPYNDVIEETANKILFSKRSKVKALAGAFETVIDLQKPEGQPSQLPQGEVKITSNYGGKDVGGQLQHVESLEWEVVAKGEEKGEILTLGNQLDWDIEAELSQLEQSQQEELTVGNKQVTI